MFNKMIFLNQRGVSLIIVFLIMTVIIAIVFSIGTILFNEIKIIGNIGNSISAFYAADSGVEKTLYFDRKNILTGANRGFCNICNACNEASPDPETDCNNCTTTPLAVDGCDPLTCTNCQIYYESAFNGRSYKIESEVNIDSINPELSVFNLKSNGYYRENTRAINLNYSSDLQSSSGYGTLIVTKLTTEGDGVFNFTGNNGLGSFQISTSNGDGSFTFNNFPVGTYSITEQVPSGWIMISNNCQNVVISNSTTSTCAITNSPEGSGQSGSLVLNPGNGNLAINIQVYGENNTFYFTVDEIEGSYEISTTNGIGNYTFNNIPAGIYHVRIQIPPNWYKVYDTCETINVTADSTTNCTIISVPEYCSEGLQFAEGVPFLISCPLAD